MQVLHTALPAEQLGHALNAAVVGLCAAPAQQQEQAAQLPAPCLGLGIVRAVDARRRLLYVLTPLPEERLQAVAALQLGRLELPARLLQTGAVMAPHMALFCMSSIGTGAGAIKSRNNLLRQSQL